MNKHIYNGANVASILLTSIGTGFIDWRYGLIVAGLMTLGVSLYTAGLIVKGR